MWRERERERGSEEEERIREGCLPGMGHLLGAGFESAGGHPQIIS